MTDQAATLPGVVHLIDRQPQMTGTETARGAHPAAAVRRRDVRQLPLRPGVPIAGGREAASAGVRRRWAAGQARRALPPRAEAAGDQARRLPGRRLRRRQDPPARRDLPRDARPAEVLRILHRVHGAGRRARLPQHGRPAPRIRPALHRRVRARRPGRHDGDDPAARRAGRVRHAARRDLEHPAERARRGPVRRAGLPPRDPPDVGQLRDDPDRRRRLPPARAGRACGHARGRRVRARRSPP